MIITAEDDGDDFRKAHLPTLYILMGIALFILILAIVNFINLSTAQSIRRAKEIGIRKVLGSKRSGLAGQFLIETLVLTILAAGLSVLMVNPVLSLFRDFIPGGVQFDPSKPETLGFLLLVTAVTTLAVGFYPAKVLSSYLPVISLKGTALQKNDGNWNLRRGLIVFQFAISLIFIIGSLVIRNQISFMRNADKGFKTDAVITVNKWFDRSGKVKVWAERIRRLKGVEKVISQGNAPMGFAHGFGDFKYKGKSEKNLQISIESGDEHFIPFYGMRLIAGRNIIHSDSLEELVINETCSKALGFAIPEAALGKFLYDGNGNSFPIVGVIADFHEGSFHEIIPPVLIGNIPQRQWSVAVKLDSRGKHITETKALVAQMENQWKKLFPENVFSYSFLDESITRLYEKDQQTAWLVNAATIITIFISCMGLFGLAMFSAELRKKEIGIRKVLGAGMLQIAALLSKDFLILVSLAILIASPVAWYFMNRWLQDFAYRIPVHWWVFVLSGLTAMLIALITVSFQAIRAGLVNPVDSLRSE